MENHIIRFTAAKILGDDTGKVEVVLSETNDRKPRLGEIIIDSITHISYMTIITHNNCTPSKFVIKCLSKEDIPKIKESDIINNEFVPFHLENTHKNYGVGITQLSFESSGPMPNGIAKYMLEWLEKTKKSMGIKNGKEGNRG